MSKTEQGKVFLAVPAYGRMIDFGNATATLNTGYQNVMVTYGSISLLAYNFNRLMCDAYNKRKEYGLTHFCLMHADIAPEPGFLGKMMDIMADKDLDVLSAVAPLKGAEGYTSCALDTKNPYRCRRITMTEVMRLPPTFGPADCKFELGNDKLLINTGLLLWRMDRLDPMKVHFKFEDNVAQDASGNYMARNVPEDWLFSRMIYKRKLRYAATREVGLMHVGSWYWTNQDVWGKETDKI